MNRKFAGGPSFWRMTMNFRNLEEHQLIDLAAKVMDELKRRMDSASVRSRRVEFTQTPSTLLTFEDGAPVDRSGWLYVPALRPISKAFQPKSLGAARLYSETLPEGTVLCVKDRRENNVVDRIKVDDGCYYSRGGDFFVRTA
ncbi:MAG TPA: hypothetical protein DCR11_10685 [Deltaproteobacteria bacterium]|nr:hypothetical protein [Deltaproteobacteria bacterium]